MLILNAASEIELDRAFAELVAKQVGGLIVGPDPFFNSRRDYLIALVARHAVPTIYYDRVYVESGGLISYGNNIAKTYRQVGRLVGRILAGAKPADLPVEQPVKFELVIDLKTATALGLTVPQALLARADEVIE